ncbi:MAG: hypothetical protein AAF596_04075 [Planctomycetota bacterium]
MRYSFAVRDGSHSLVTVFLLAVAASAQDTAPLRYRFTEGETLRYRVTQTATLSGDADVAGSFDLRTEQVTELAWRVVSVDEEGSATIEQTVPRLRFTNSLPTGDVGFDSDSDDPPMGVAAMLTPAARTLLETPVTFAVGPGGTVREITASEDLIGALDRIPGASGVLEWEPALRSLIETVLPLLPTGDEPATRRADYETPSFGRVELVTVFTRGPTEESGVARIVLTVTADSSAVAEGVVARIVESTGVALFVEETGRLQSSDSSLTLELVVDNATATLTQTSRVQQIGDRDPAE